MKNTQVVNLGRIKDLLAEWEKVRASLVSGGLDSFHVVLTMQDGKKKAFIGGATRSASAIRSILKASAARMLAEDPPLLVEQDDPAKEPPPKLKRH